MYLALSILQTIQRILKRKTQTRLLLEHKILKHHGLLNHQASSKTFDLTSCRNVTLHENIEFGVSTAFNEPRAIKGAGIHGRGVTIENLSYGFIPISSSLALEGEPLSNTNRKSVPKKTSTNFNVVNQIMIYIRISFPYILFLLA